MPELRTLGIATDLGEPQMAQLRQRFPDITIKVALERDEIPGAFEDIDAFVGSTYLVHLLDGAPRLRWIQTTNAGANVLPFPDLVQRGIVVTNNSGAQAPNLAEHIMALMYAFARGLPALMRAQQRHEWVREGRRFELHEQTLCVVGLGDIGLELAKRASGVGMRVTGVRRRDLPAPEFVERVALMENMDEVLADTDHVGICLPLTERTRYLFDARRLGGMKQGAYIYNVGRGDIIEQDAMIELLRSGHLGGAGLDVVTPEPLPADSPRWDMENVIITNHTGGSPPRRDRMIGLLLENIARFQADEPLLNVVDPAEGY
jgi:D-2-hydroxyacid dehydrogenase (NADP+)